MKLTNKLNLPHQIMQALVNDEYSRGKSDISVTQLIDAPQIVKLKREHADEIIEDASDMLWALGGNALHKYMELYSGSEYMCEQRFFRKVNGWTISGCADSISVQRPHTIYDYKFISAYPFVKGGKDAWEQQLNLLAWLALADKGIKVEALSIIGFIKDFNKYEAMRDANYPKSPIHEHKVKLWTNFEQEAFVEYRLKLHQSCFNSPAPPCTDEERWMQPQQWAIMKPKAKRATKVENSLEAAQKYLDKNKKKCLGASIVERPKVFRRCAEYCSVNKFCTQYQNELKQERN